MKLSKILSILSLTATIVTVQIVGLPSQKLKEAQAHCPLNDPRHCASHADPTPYIHGSKEVAEAAWGEAGASAYQAAASTMRARNGNSQGLDEVQKKYLRPHFGDLVNQVVVIYNARMMDQWSAFGKSINLSGVDTAAQTYCNRIYVRDSYKPNDFQQLILLSHEMTHSKQCEQLGGEGKFGFHYFREFKRGGQSYEGNKLEKEANNFENQFAASLRSPASIRTTICNQVSSRATFYLNADLKSLEGNSCGSYTLPKGSQLKTSYGKDGKRFQILVTLEGTTYDLLKHSSGDLELRRR
jgi:hypothetical protein